jgi:hypothetical protein
MNPKEYMVSWSNPFPRITQELRFGMKLEEDAMSMTLITIRPVKGSLHLVRVTSCHREEYVKLAVLTWLETLEPRNGTFSIQRIIDEEQLGNVHRPPALWWLPF